ncbi:MAG: N-acetylmuramoyl-L-alanine amidase [Oscillospiraceae bacterium]|nr:N-acetylmuramoyl-L-alanine amidase [Oscillospiraceae bacterium]
MKKLTKTLSILITTAYLFSIFTMPTSFAAPVPEDDELASVSDFENGAEPEYTEPPRHSPGYFLPDNMRGVIISPEIDFLTSETDNKAEVTLQLHEIFEYISGIGLNAVIIKTSVEDRLYYDLDMNRNGKEDFTQLAVQAARDFHLGVYLIYDIGYAINPKSDYETAMDTLASEAHRFAIKYHCDGIILDNYYNDPATNNFARYMRGGSGIGYENWLFDSTEYLFETAGAIIRLTDSTIPVGVMINDMWANSESMEGGSPTNDSVQAYFDGFADTKKYIERGYADFLTLRCFGSLTSEALRFEPMAEWWGELCKANNIPMYLIHYNEKLGDGWPEDQILRQLKVSKENITAYNGSLFNSYQSLKANTLNSAETLRKYYAEEIDEDSLFEDLVMHSPKNLSFTTYEPTVDFMGSFDRNFDVFFNDRRIDLNDAGNFFFEMPLDIGSNTFTLRHKGRTYTYKIERRIIVMRDIDISIAEGKTLNVDGGTSITLAAEAYRGASVTATLNGQTIKLQEQSGTLEDEDVNSAYTRFTGSYTVPDGIIGVAQPLGQINIQASYLGQSASRIGSSVTVNAEPEPPPVLRAIMYDDTMLGTGEVVGTIDAVRTSDESVTFVRVSNNHTNVFDARTTGTVFNPAYSQMPAGTLDYFRGTSGTFYTTESGKRYNQDDVTLQDGNGIGDNRLVVLAGGIRSGQEFFEISLDTKISYNVEVVGMNFFTAWGTEYNIRSFDAEYVQITFDNVTSVTKLPPFDANLVFSSGTWEQVTIDGVAKFRLILKLRTKGVYAGNSAHYNSEGNLMLTFPVLKNNLSGMTIVIDPGHGISANGKLDPGAIGHIIEYDANLAVAKKLEAMLNAYGANAIRLRSEDRHIDARRRPIEARNLGADMFISLHSNRVSDGGTARGTEVFYYTPFSQPLADSISRNVARYFTNNVYSDREDKNRGAKNSYFWVTVQQDFPSVLVELGFVSNLEDAMALANSQHQDGIVDAIIQGIQDYLSRSSISYSSDGTASIPETFLPEEPDYDNDYDTPFYDEENYW